MGELFDLLSERRPFGGTKMVTDRNGPVVSLHDYLPFGRGISGAACGRGSTLFAASAGGVITGIGWDRDKSGLECEAG